MGWVTVEEHCTAYQCFQCSNNLHSHICSRLWLTHYTLIYLSATLKHLKGRFGIIIHRPYLHIMGIMGVTETSFEATLGAKSKE